MSQGLFLGLLLALGLQRLAELRLSARNERRLLARGGYEVAPGHFRWMKALHIAWFAGMAGEVTLGGAAPHPAGVALGLLGLAAGQLLRYAAICTLGPRWTVRVLVVPGEPLVSTGIYSHLRHPNYLGVCLELAAVPLLGGAYRSALIFSFLNALVLRRRIALEEQALLQAGER